MQGTRRCRVSRFYCIPRERLQSPQQQTWPYSKATGGSPSSPLKSGPCILKRDSISGAIRHGGDVSTVLQQVNTALQRAIMAISSEGPPPSAHLEPVSPHRRPGCLTFDPKSLPSVFVCFHPAAQTRPRADVAALRRQHGRRSIIPPWRRWSQEASRFRAVCR